MPPAAMPQEDVVLHNVPISVTGAARMEQKLEDKPYGDRPISAVSVNPSSHGLDTLGIGNTLEEHWNLPSAALYEHAIQRGEGRIVHLGPLCVRTGKHTGRAAGDKYFVKEPGSEEHIAWGGGNQEMSEQNFEWLYRKATAYYQNRSVYVMDVKAGHDSKNCLPARVVTETAWHALFVRTMFIRPEDEELGDHVPQFTVLHVPGMKANPAEDGTKSETFIALHMTRRVAIIGGTFYAGEVKKCIFTACNYYFPLRGVLTMHAAANMGKEGDVAVFFGLSGTGKTTLSADPERDIIGDDEHCWSDDTVSNIEGGCYAKVIRLSKEAEPDIWRTTRQFGTIIENVVMNPVTRRLDLSDGSITENTRAAYPLHFIKNRREDGLGGIPTNVVMLTCDAFGVLPPISKLTAHQASFWFLSGYTAKVAGTELGVKEPQATFSACFGLPFMPLRPTVYAKMLREKIEKHNVHVWLLNTGWTGGAYGEGKRFSIQMTRKLLSSALNGHLTQVEYTTDSIFNLSFPKSCEGVESELLDPRNTWSDKAAYDKQAKSLAAACVKAFKPYESLVDPAVLASGPKAE
ncbi:uncharacterized protein MONBRDRAFT_18344 [Monosiga brevicollis MX1]|uniref:phosphoenolpyruvate carboxykinase (ATP) n=1 Tax=Monosiga brevicollis TaxID=81824 RepID=A9UUG8_MONBE|nr:uncharacterized protein MONBRDRAFT_18344 [Monosiga brevicollis MX1]EDQ90899.1 predicted protein [Monosiga brevicollis MX1]|eukprot:XP_001744196.1 hypothetical protein [Monosiga brevicollis MX1]